MFLFMLFGRTEHAQQNFFIQPVPETLVLKLSSYESMLSYEALLLEGHYRALKKVSIASASLSTPSLSSSGE